MTAVTSAVTLAREGCPDGALLSTSKLWMGDLEPFMDEVFLISVYAQFGYHAQSIRWIRNYQTGLVARYCFVEFSDSSAARQALEALNGQPIPGTNGTKRFKLNWANRKVDSGQTDFNVFVADLSRDVTSQQLLEFFQQRYKSIRYAKVVEDDDGVSKGYGFVRFMEERERDLSLVEMAGAVGLGRKALTIKPALAPKSKTPMMPVPDASSSAMGHSYNPAGGQPWAMPTILPTPYMPPPPQHPVMMPHLLVPQTGPLVHGYVEDLVDPSPPLEQEQANRPFVCWEAELYLELEACRWQAQPDTRVL